MHCERGQHQNVSRLLAKWDGEPNPLLKLAEDFNNENLIAMLKELGNCAATSRLISSLWFIYYENFYISLEYRSALTRLLDFYDGRRACFRNQKGKY